MSSNNFYENLMSQWVDGQKKYFEFWQDSFIPQKQTNTAGDIYSNLIKKNIDAYTEWIKLSYDNFFKLSSMKGENPVGDIMKKMTSASELYSSMYNMWANINEQASVFNPQKAQEFYNKWQENYMKMLMDNFISYLPKPLQDMYNQQSSLYDTYYETANKFFQPWIVNAQDFQNLLFKNIFTDKDAFINYIKLWKESYQKSIGKLLEMPAMGMYKGQHEQLSKSIDSYAEYMITIFEYTAILQKVAYEAMENIIKEYPDMLKNQLQPKTFREFYEYWWQKNEENYMKLFKTDEFSKLLAKVVDSGVNFKKQFNKLMEQQLEVLPVATDKDINQLYKTIYDLKKQVKSMDKEMAEVKEQLKKYESGKSKEV